MWDREETLLDLGRFAIMRHLAGFPAGRVKIVNQETGLVDWPILYDHGGVAFEFPFKTPFYAQRASVLFLDPGQYTEERAQLAIASAFMHETAEGDPFNWGGEMPYYIDAYDAAGWNEDNRPIHLIWAGFLGDLEREGRLERLAQAKELPIGDLLVESRDAPCPDYYLGM